MLYKKILVAYEEHDRDDSIVKAAFSMAHQYGSEVTILHIQDPQAGKVGGMAKIDRGHKYTEQEIEDALSGVDKQGVSFSIKLIETEWIVKSVVKEAESFDILVLGHHHMGVFEEMTRDTTDERIINRLSCHTLVIPVKN